MRLDKLEKYTKITTTNLGERRRAICQVNPRFVFLYHGGQEIMNDLGYDYDANYKNFALDDKQDAQLFGNLLKTLGVKFEYDVEPTTCEHGTHIKDMHIFRMTLPQYYKFSVRFANILVKKAKVSEEKE